MGDPREPAARTAWAQWALSNDRAEYLWFLEHGFRWPLTLDERADIYPTNEYEIKKRGEKLSEQNRAEARYEDARREARFEMAQPEWEWFLARQDARLEALEPGE